MAWNRSLAGRIVATALVSCAATGCAGWKRAELVEGSRLPPRQEVQVWTAGTATVLHAVSLERDTLYGVPFFKPPTCDSCRVGIPRAGVDSVRLGNQELPGMIIAFAPIVAVIGFWVLYGLASSGD